MIFKFRMYLCMILVLGSARVCAKMTPLKHAESELISFASYANRMMCNRNGSNSDVSLVDEYMAQENYLHAKEILSVEQQTRLLLCAQLFDQAYMMEDKEAREKMLQSVIAGLDSEIAAIKAESFHAGSPMSRVAPREKRAEKKLYKVSPKQSVQTDSPREDLSDFEKLLESQVAQKMAVGQDASLGGIVGSLFENKEKIALGLLTLYAIVARANEWPPYNKKEVKPETTSWTHTAISPITSLCGLVACLDNG